MVLVRVDVPLRPKNQSVSNDKSINESAPAQAPPPPAAHESYSHVEQRVAIDSVNKSQAATSQSSPQPYYAQLLLLEQQNKKRLLQMAEKEQRQGNSNKRVNGSLGSNAASREDYHMQQIALEQENGKRLIGARNQLAGQTAGANDSRNQGHDAQAIAGSFQLSDHVSYVKHPMLLEEQSQRQWGLAEQLRESNFIPDGSHIKEEDAAQQSTASRLASNNQVEDKWGRGPFQAGQGVIAGYQAQLAALENKRKEAAAERSQAEAEIFRLSGRLPPGAP
ncbi:hypothetical protein BKA64DRAFT_683870 [Cadophora sp. MPI-SDFR-AT-0126]|nr:hypothetical protein BKA64DRAFT_683870 [Leotiomycetes sp. MPI-SDFR-AT-0126]